VVVILRGRADRHRPTLRPGAGVAHVVGSAHLEGVGLILLADKAGAGLGGVGIPANPLPAAHLILDVIVAHASEPVLAGPGHLEAERRGGGDLDAGRRSHGVPDHGEGLRGRVAGAVAGGDGQRGAKGVVGVEGIGMRLDGSRRLRESQAEAQLV
jgi:hypothetical protein